MTPASVSTLAARTLPPDYFLCPVTFAPRSITSQHLITSAPRHRPPSLCPVSAHQPSPFRAQHSRGAADLVNLRYKTILRAGVVLYGEWSHYTISPRQKILQCCHNCGMKLCAAHGNTWKMSICPFKCQFSYKDTQLSFILKFIYLH